MITKYYLLFESTLLVLWGLGFPDQSLQRSREALSLAHEREQPYTLVLALNFTNILFLRRREPERVQQGAEQQIALATKYGLDTWSINGRIFKSWARNLPRNLQRNLQKQNLPDGNQENDNQQDGNQNDAAYIKHGLETRIVTGGELTLPFWLSILAEVYIQHGQLPEALHELDTALSIMNRTGDCEWAAELFRLKGAVLYAQHQVQDAEACYQQALTIARQQQAKMLELRASIDLAGLWWKQGKANAAYTPLASVYEWYQEGVDTADLQNAKLLLTELD